MNIGETVNDLIGSRVTDKKYIQLLFTEKPTGKGMSPVNDGLLIDILCRHVRGILGLMCFVF